MSTEHTFRVPDRKAPAFLKKRFNILTDKEFFVRMRKEYPELAVYKDREIARFIEATNIRMSKEIIDNRNGLQLPYSLGIVVAGACRISPETAKRNIDYGASNKAGKIILHSNQTSDGYISKVKYSNVNERFPFRNNHMWCFDPVRRVSRTIANIFKQEGGYKKYIVFTTRQHIGHLFRPTKPSKPTPIVKRNAEKKKYFVNKHNEFDI